MFGKIYIERGYAKFELCAILVGLEVAQLRNYSKVIVESDYLDAIEMILGNSVNIPSMTIIRRINEVEESYKKLSSNLFQGRYYSLQLVKLLK
ncbi:hypothetical protein J1N35_029349 [Gossypium stocksii]|uniref:RNase H type-1 domain-containing protein n=1 Tax=Gossypium stocksii TaxID=47602 RepID=A0A9D3UYQ9_9ROSI|nr:hypothetical protein J1N35_029349 [Gossypium stocksii]